MSSYGGPASTPAIDRLAAGGIRFDFVHAHAVMTLPPRALATDPGSSRAYSGLSANAMRRGDRQAACEACGRAVTLDPANHEAMYNLGVNLAREGRMAEARPYLEEFLKSAPSAEHGDQLKIVAFLLQ